MTLLSLANFGMPRQVTVQERPEVLPPLKWAGGKRWLVPELRKFWKGNEDRRLVEPFVGGMAVALGLRPDRALLNDFNEHVINFYSWLQKGLKLTTPSEPDEKTYYANRRRFNNLVPATSNRPTNSEGWGLFVEFNTRDFPHFDPA